jgi:hypothetical protein
MKIANTRLKKVLVTVFGIIMLIMVVGVILISPIAKHLIEKYSDKYTGRKIKAGLVYVNPFTGYIHIHNLKIYESDSMPAISKGDSVFFSAKDVGAKFALLKLFKKTIEITKLTINQPKGIIIQKDKDFNFSDLIKKFTPEKSDSTPPAFHVNILALTIKNGAFYYHEKNIPVKYFIKNVNLGSPGKYWNEDTIVAKFSFSAGMGSGTVKGNLMINLKSLDYRIEAMVKEYDLKFIEQYMKDLMNYGTFSANVDADIKAKGNLNDQEDLDAKGSLAMNDFHFGITPEDDYVAFDKLSLKIDDLSPKNHQYVFDSISLNHPYIKYERYDYLDNLQRMFGEKGANISAAKADPVRFNLILQIADYVKVLAKNFFKSDYKINKLAIYKGELKFNDYALTEEFSTETNSLYVHADSVNKSRKRVEVSFRSVIIPYGHIGVNLSINPRDSADFDLVYHLQSLPIAMLNPYLITYTSFPMDGGTLELNGTWKVRRGIIKSDNHMLVIDPLLTERVKNNDTKWIPSPLIMAFIRERGNVIDYEIPITGNMKNPKFHLHDVISDILGNIFVKPATIPYRSEVKYLENEIEKSHALQWKIRESSQLPSQKKFLYQIVEFLQRNPDASISVYPMQYANREKESIRFFEAKKKYFLLSKNSNAQFLTEADSLLVEKMSVKDSLFVHYLNKQLNDSMLFTIQDKCNSFIGQAIVNTRFQQLNKKRESVFMSYFKDKGVEKQVKIFSGENTIPYNGFSFFKIKYKGEMPATLIKAYKEMNELNNKPPRRRFKNEREKNKDTSQKN